MDRDTILIPADCELRRLPLDAVEAFVLAQVDGRLTLEEIGEIAGLDLAKTARLAKRLVELGAVTPLGGPRPSRPRKASKSPSRAPSRPDPRADPVSIAPASHAAKRSKRPPPPVSTRVDPRAEKASMRPPVRAEKEKEKEKEPRKEGRRSTKSLRAQRLADDACELDEATVTRITTLDARLATVDHYALLEVERSAEKKDIKRAYFALAATFHPDRFFRKKLGLARAPLDRIFIRLTEAHDTLSNRARRAAYDATLPSAPPARRPSRRLSKTLARQSKTMKAAQVPPPVPPPPVLIIPPPVPHAIPVQPEIAPVSEGRFQRIYAAATQIKAQAHIDVFLQAAEEALRADDMIGAANNYRLALQNGEDPIIRKKLDLIDELAKSARSEKSLARARAAERDNRWPDAATHYAKAHEARPAAAVAERAAHALRLGGGDLHRAAALAEEATQLDPKNVVNRVTLAEIYLAANLLSRASAEVARALELAPKDARVLELAAALKKKK